MLVIRDGELNASTVSNSKDGTEKEELEEDPAEEDVSPSPKLSPDINPDDSDDEEEENAEVMEQHRK